METTELKDLKTDAKLDSSKVSNAEILSWANAVIANEAAAIRNLTKSINEDFVLAVQMILDCSGKCILIGMGKSGHIANKVAATFASTGTSSFFVHPAEAVHGDLGMINACDIVIGISNSGETSELIEILPHIKRIGAKLISISNNKNSTLAKYADCSLEINVGEEACSLGLAPTTSTTATLALGDALAVSLLNARGFSKDDFAKNHPGGTLGRNLLVKIKDVMHKGNDIPKLVEDMSIANALPEVSQKRLGMGIVISKNCPDTMIGVFTDGDLRRAISQGVDLYNTKIKDVMTESPLYVNSEMLGAKALQIMEHNKILVMPVIDNGKVVGAFNMHDLFKAGVA